MPFQKTVADIPTAVDYSATPAMPGSGASIQLAGEVAGETIKGVQKNRLESDVQQTADVATAVAGAVAEKGATAFTPTGELNTEGLSPDLQQQISRVKANAGDKFKRIANAVRQGAKSEAAAALETEATVRRLVSQTPGFGSEIKQLARELVGFDPSGYALRQILGVDKPRGSTRQTAQEKRIEEAQVIQDGLARVGQNIPLDTILGNLAIRDRAKMQQEILDADLDIGTHNLRQWAQTSFVEAGPDLTATLLNVAQMGAEGGVTEPAQYTNAVIQQREAHKQLFRSQVASRGGMDVGQAQAIEGQIDSLYAPLLKSVEQNQLGKLLETKLDVVAKVNQLWGKQATPKLTRIVDAYGPQVGGQILEMMSNIADPKQFELVFSFDPGLREVIQQGKLTQTQAADGVEAVISKVISGENLTEDDLQFRKMAETLVTQPGNKETREAFVKGLGQGGAPVRAVSILTEKVHRSQATPDEIKFVKNQFDTYVGTAATEDVPGNLVDSIARELLELDVQGIQGQLQATPITQRGIRAAMMGLAPKATGQVKLTIPYDPTRQGTALDFQTTSMKRLQPFLDAAIAKGYAADLGVSPTTFAQDMIARVNARMDKLRVVEEEQTKELVETTKEQSMYTKIFDPAAVMGWALPENRPQTEEAKAAAEEELVNTYLEVVKLTESGGDPNAVSSAGALGEMQVMPSTATDKSLIARGLTLAKKNPDGTFDKEDLARFGRDYFKLQLKDFSGDFEAALIAYNAGPGNAKKWLAAGRDYSVLPRRQETEPYVRRAMKHLAELTKSKRGE
jgi:hypothetical protein